MQYSQLSIATISSFFKIIFKKNYNASYSLILFYFGKYLKKFSSQNYDHKSTLQCHLFIRRLRLTVNISFTVNNNYSTLIELYIINRIIYC